MAFMQSTWSWHTTEAHRCISIPLTAYDSHLIRPAMLPVACSWAPATATTRVSVQHAMSLILRVLRSLYTLTREHCLPAQAGKASGTCLIPQAKAHRRVNVQAVVLAQPIDVWGSLWVMICSSKKDIFCLYRPGRLNLVHSCKPNSRQTPVCSPDSPSGYGQSCSIL